MRAIYDFIVDMARGDHKKWVSAIVVGICTAFGTWIGTRTFGSGPTPSAPITTGTIPAKHSTSRRKSAYERCLGALPIERHKRSKTLAELSLAKCKADYKTRFPLSFDHQGDVACSDIIARISAHEAALKSCEVLR